MRQKQREAQERARADHASSLQPSSSPQPFALALDDRRSQITQAVHAASWQHLAKAIRTSIGETTKKKKVTI